MSTSAISGNQFSSYQLNLSSTTSSVAVDRDGDNDGSGAVSGAHQGHRGHGGSAFMQGVIQTLGQLGLSLPVPGASNTQSSAATSSTTSSATAAPSVADALHAFMHTLFQTLHNAGSGQTAGGTDADGDNDGSRSVSAPQSHYGDFASRLQNLMQTLTTNSAGGSNGNSSDLQTAFQNLVTAIGGGSSTNGQGPTLQAFLQDLMQNLNGQGNTPASALGGTVNTAA